MKKLILSCALTGAATNRNHCPHIPYTPKELGEEGRRAVDAGASILHIHAREDDGTPSWRTEVFEAIHEEVRQRCPNVIINFSTGAIGLSKEERMKHIPVTRPDVAAFNMSSMNYAIYSKKNKKFYWDGVFENSYTTMQYVINLINEAGTCPEMECFDTGHIRNADIFRDMGLLPDNATYSLVMGVMGGIPATPENLIHQIKQVPEGRHWQSIVISRDQWRLSAIAAAMGGSFRVGMEDNFYLPSGEMAKSNGELVEEGAKLAQLIGRQIATTEEAREMLNIPFRH